MTVESAFCTVCPLPGGGLPGDVLMCVRFASDPVWLYMQGRYHNWFVFKEGFWDELGVELFNGITFEVGVSKTPAYLAWGVLPKIVKNKVIAMVEKEYASWASIREADCG